MKKSSKEILTIAERKELKGNYSPVIDRAIEALEAAEDGRIEPEEVEFKNGEWYASDYTFTLVIEKVKGEEEYFNCVGLEKRGGEWIWLKEGVCDLTGMQPADMKEVEKLLIGEAEKRGFDKYVDYIWDGMRYDRKTLHFNDDGSLRGHTAGIIFSPETGKWAEIVREPLYKNDYGTEFFEGDEYFYISNSYKIIKENCGFCKDALNDNTDNKLNVPFIGIERECFRWLYENWDKLKK